LLLYDKIDYLCEKKSISRKKLCENIDLSYATLNSMITRNSSSISVDTLVNISTYFNISLDYLLDDSIPMSEIRYKEDASKKDLVNKINNLSDNKKLILHGYIDGLLEDSQ